MDQIVIGRRALAAMACAAALASRPAAASAMVRYELRGQVYASPSMPLAPPEAFSLSFTVSGEAVRRGGIAVSSRHGALPLAGDAADLVSLDVFGDPPLTQSSIRGSVDLRVAFAPDGSVTDFHLDYLGVSSEARLRSLGGTLVGGGYGSDLLGPHCGLDGPFGPNRVLTGRIEAPGLAVPEPAMVALLAGRSRGRA